MIFHNNINTIHTHNLLLEFIDGTDQTVMNKLLTCSSLPVLTQLLQYKTNQAALHSVF